MKIHGNYFYSTTTKHGEKCLKKCSLSYEKMWDTSKKRKLIGIFLKKCYIVGLAYGIPEIQLSFLLKPQSVIYLTTIYNGVGIKGHIDKNFFGAVFCYVSFIKKTKRDDYYNKRYIDGCNKGKQLSWTIKGLDCLIDGGAIENHENQLYWFYGYFTDYGVHGVPRMGGYLTIVHIFRQARPNAICVQ